MSRILNYDRSEKIEDDGPRRTGERKPMPIDGQHIAVVAEMGDPFERRSDGNFIMGIRMDIVGSDAQITLWLDCHKDGSFKNTWKGLGKFHDFCDALNLQEGSYQDTAFIGCALCIEVVTTKDRNGKSWKNIKRMWACSEAENEKAVRWLASRG